MDFKKLIEAVQALVDAHSYASGCALDWLPDDPDMQEYSGEIRDELNENAQKVQADAELLTEALKSLQAASVNDSLTKELSYAGLYRLFQAVEAVGNSRVHVEGRILFTQDSFNKEYSEAARTYVVSSDNKAFRPNTGGYSIYGTSLDGTDRMVRLERYMAAEHGGKDGWKVEKCSVNGVDFVLGFEAYAQQQLDNMSYHQKNTEPCPRCGGPMSPRNAVSRRSKMEVCPACGTDEAIREMRGQPLRASEWWIFRNRDLLTEINGKR